jgi:hypothetical protein
MLFIQNKPSNCFHFCRVTKGAASDHTGSPMTLLDLQTMAPIKKIYAYFAAGEDHENITKITMYDQQVYTEHTCLQSMFEKMRFPPLSDNVFCKLVNKLALHCKFRPVWCQIINPIEVP